MRSLVVSMFRRGVMKQHLYQNFSSSDGESFLRMVESYFDKAGKQLRCWDISQKKLSQYALNSLALGNDIYDIVEEQEDVFWIGARQGLCYIDIKAKISKWYPLQVAKDTLLSNTSILSICLDPQEPARYLWLGTRRGLRRLDKQTQLLDQLYTLQDGLPNNTVYGILADKQGNLWLSTNQGICKFNPKKEGFRGGSRHWHLDLVLINQTQSLSIIYSYLFNIL